MKYESRKAAGRFAGCLLLLAALLSLPLAAQKRTGLLTKQELTEGNRNLAKVSSRLLQARELARQATSAKLVLEAVPLLRLRDGLPEIEIRLKSLNPAIVEQVKEIGMQVGSVSLQYARINGWADPDLLDELAAIPEVATIHPNYGAITMAGSVANQADISIRADLARSTLGVDGSGVTVGILSDSFNNTLGGAVAGAGCSRTVTGMTNQGSDDLPASVVLLDDGPGGFTDEGAAIGELIFDLAPGANQMFHSAFNSEADFATGITELKNCGADVLVDDVFYFAEPMFQDGIIAQAAQDAVDMDVPYFSSAGNQATFGVDDFYIDSNASDDIIFPPTGNDLHDFNPGGGLDRFAEIIIPDDCDLLAVLQWNEPYDGTLGPGASSDLDFYIYDGPSPGAGILDLSFSGQGCGVSLPSGGNPFEIVSYFNNTGFPQAVYLAVEHFCGDESARLRIATFGSCGLPGAYTFETGIYVDPQIYGHAAAEGVLAVAASFYGEIDSGGALQGGPEIDVEDFSSLGGDLPFYFDGSGNPLAGAPVLRTKPEITAPDGTNTTFFGIDIGFDVDSDPNFFGTSAAAPHAAAVAALMLDLGNLTPSGLTQVIEQGTFDMELPGLDELSGLGLVDALNSVGTTTPTAPDCYINDLFFDGIPNTPATPGTINQTFRACNSLTLGAGIFDNLEGHADSIIFTDGFESGDTSAWSNDVP